MVYENKDGDYTPQEAFHLKEIQEAAAAAKFNEHDTEAVTPTLKINDSVEPAALLEGVIHHIKFMIKDAAGDMFKLRIWEEAVTGATKPYELAQAKLFETEGWKTSDQEYDYEVSIPFKLATQGEMFYGLEWNTGSAPAGNVQGYLKVSGIKFK